VFFRRVLLPVKNCYVHTHLPVKMEAAESMTRLTANLTSVRVRANLHGGLQKRILIEVCPCICLQLGADCY